MELGAGINPDKTDKLSILNAVNQVLSGSAYKNNAKEISKGFKKCPGAKGAADKIIKMCRDKA